MEKQPFFMVFVENERTPTFKHEILDQAETEARRLCGQTRKTTYVLASIKSFSIPDEFIVEDLRPIGDSLPF